MRTIIEARKIIYQLLAKRGDDGRSTTVTDVHFVLCEDDATVMIYVDVTDERDALAVCFDLKPGEEFEPQRYRHEFFKRASLVVV